MRRGPRGIQTNALDGKHQLVRHQSTNGECAGRSGLGRFIETLLSGIPWSERAEATATVTVARPASEIPGRGNRRGRVDMELRIPRELTVQVTAANGKVCVQGLRGSVRARSSNGAVRIEDVIGNPEIATSNAKVSCLCTCGHLTARSSNGTIELEDHRGSGEAGTPNGPTHWHA